MNKTEFIENLYQCVDARSVAGLSAFLDPDVNFQFANAEPIQGKENVLDANRAFFSAIGAMSHRIDNIWAQAQAIICHGQVDYTRLDGSAYSAAFATILTVKDKLITDYRIYADVSDL